MHYDLDNTGGVHLWFDWGACEKLKGVSTFTTMSFNHKKTDGKLLSEVGLVWSNDKMGAMCGLSKDHEENRVYNEKCWYKSGKLSAGCLNSMNLKSFTMLSHSSCLEYRVNNDLTLWLCEKLDCSDGGALAGLKALAVDTGVSLVKKMGKTTLAACV